ncbi:hypothetical protein Pcac1_g11745 [Phytophthora cactorum]|uniref:Uncharacterized protein n=2 Tax=Phytophthora cactorum TaxID=29920 RepID=A0A329RJH6_9STRA|nr:hypothetical protein Pcac1_g11745 [Phytophthora cactorum]KAG2847241.1 hypothetical protein PC111_g867 [Phytophthora cactorum]RAW24885.1 hypothetical protein PC110_g18687 [Phytophthora cactorum]
MATHNDKKCRRCSCRNKECQRRRVEQRRQGKSLVPHAQFLLIHCSRRRQNTILKVPSFEMDGGEELQPDEVAIDSEDLQVMRDSVNRMQQQISRGLRHIQEIRALVKQAAAQRDLQLREMTTQKVNTKSTRR